MSEIKLEFTKDFSGFPTSVKVSKGAKVLNGLFDKDSGFKLSGDRRSLSDPDLFEALKLIYPFNEQPVLSIPQPLQTIAVQGGSEVLMFDDFEALLKWTQGAATVAISNTVAFGGSQSLHLTALNGATAIAHRSFSLPKSRKIEFSCHWGIDLMANLDTVNFGLYYYTGTVLHAATIVYNPTSLTWEFLNTAGTYTDIPTARNVLYHNLDAVGGAWHTAKLKADFTNFRYISLEANEFELNMSGYPVYQVASAEERHCLVVLMVNAGLAVNCEGWFDNVLVREVT